MDRKHNKNIVPFEKELKVGYAASNINPKMGFGIMGYYVPRYVSGFLEGLLSDYTAL